MIWEHALNAAMGMKRIYSSIIILAVNVGWYVIVWLSRGHCCILETPCPAYFDSWLDL